MKKIFKLYILLFFLLLNFISFAQGIGTGGGEPPLEEPNDPQPASLDSKLIYLLIIGLLFAIYTMQKRTKRT